MEMNVDTFPGIAHYKGPPLLGWVNLLLLPSYDLRWHRSFIVSSILCGSIILSFVQYLQFSYTTDRRATKVLVVSGSLSGLKSDGKELISN